MHYPTALRLPKPPRLHNSVLEYGRRSKENEGRGEKKKKKEKSRFARQNPAHHALWVRLYSYE
ncbi:unnamed protein product [Tuber melanosporum]|uniref:(Perigord truffle) hypothetical protein n=1 Tax=Tuber melanosporum (strain Mel28) TaxID=656061 RepID=D5GMN7_TUBMM|nr:uncharacterized protein GSTUM_00010833001 [Tuber melanosporum]CAZ85780.1 unnamed protein product [Tuber melanosporum]